MANFLVTYDLNGPVPSHKQVDEHLQKLGAARARILETVWYVGWNGTAAQLYDKIITIFSNNDRLIVVEAVDAKFKNLLVEHKSLVAAWQENRRR